MKSYRQLTRAGGIALVAVWTLAGCGGGDVTATPTSSTVITHTVPVSSTSADDEAARLDAILTDVNSMVTAVAAAPTSESDPSTDSINLAAKAQTAIIERVEALHQLRSKVEASSTITSAHRAGLLTEVDAMTLDLQSLGSDVSTAAATDSGAVRAKVAAIVTRYRVYALETPKVHMMLALDSLDAGVVLAQRRLATTNDALDALSAAGKDVTAQRTSLARLQTTLDNARSVSATYASDVLGLEPGGYPANLQALSKARVVSKNAAASVRGVVRDADGLLAELR